MTENYVREVQYVALELRSRRQSRRTAAVGKSRSISQEQGGTYLIHYRSRQFAEDKCAVRAVTAANGAAAKGLVSALTMTASGP
jgi:hypothetical protein